MIIVNMLIISISSTIQAKYIFKYQFDVANLDIDRTKPKIELLSIENSNTTDKEHANKSDIITIKIKITDRNLKEVFLNNDYLNIKIDDEYVDYVSIKFDKIEDITDGGIYQIELTNLEGNGTLKVDILEGIAVDTGELRSEVFSINTGVLIENNNNIDDNISNINNNSNVDNGNNINSNFMTFTYE